MLLETIIGGAVFVGSTTLGLAGPLYTRLVKERRFWEALSQSLEFELDWGGLSGRNAACGEYQGFQVQVRTGISTNPRWRGDWSTQYVLDAKGRLPSTLGFEHGRGESAERSTQRSIERRSGDDFFNTWVRVKGPRLMLGKLLDHKTRELLLGFVAHEGGVISGGQLRYETVGKTTDLDEVHEVLTKMRILGERLVMASGRGIEGLVENARNDPVAGVRAWNLEILARYYKRHKETQAVLQDALLDSAAEVRLTAAMKLGEQGLGELRSLVKLPELTPEQRSGALVQLAVLDEAEDVQDGLIELLSKSDAPEVRLKAIDGLARVGTLKAVEHLLPFTEGFFREGRFKRRARVAIKRIQNRSAGGETGALSIAIAEEPEGALSLPRDGKQGELSLP